MAKFCPHCGAEVPDSESRCGQCGTSVLTFGDRIRRLLGGLFKVPGVSVDFKVVVERQNKNASDVTTTAPTWEGHLGGRAGVAHGWDQIPAEMRDEVKAQLDKQGIAMPKMGVATSHREEYIVKDKSGVEQHYKSLDEMPEDLRRQIESVLPDRLRKMG